MLTDGSFDAMRLQELQTELINILDKAGQAYYTFRPRPDCPEEFDEQESFINERLPGLALHVGGNGCLHGDEPLTDAVTGETRAIRDWDIPFNVTTLNPETNEPEVGQSTRSYLKGTADLYRVSLNNGESIICTLHHKFCRPDGSFVYLANIGCGDLLMGADGHSGNIPRVESVEFFAADQPFYDITTLPYHNYAHKGVISSNSGTTTAAVRKACLFMLNQQPPPRRDTPFWIVSPTYELGIKTIWKEKMVGLGHLPGIEVDWERINWHDSKQGLPSFVPLKPWPMEAGGHPGRNWAISFKSYKQGRDQMQSESIGGFLFSEQAPWGIVEETVTRCREYMFPGAMMYEFTPVDPALTMEVEEKIVSNKLPEGWKLYRSNTVKNVEYGGVKAEWFGQWSDMLSDEMRDTRITGAFASYQGAIYKTFDSAIHTTMDLRLPSGHSYEYRRSIDWGSTKEHPFVCLYGAFDENGRWYIYDEIFDTDPGTVEDTISLVKRHMEWPERNPAYGTTYADSARPDLIRSFSQHIQITAARKDIYPGIEKVQSLLKVHPQRGPSIIIDRTRCPNLCRQMRGYRWLRSPTHGLNPRVAKPEPLKKDDDCPDALRYMVFSEHQTGTSMFGMLDTRKDIPSNLLATGKWEKYRNG